MLSLTLLLERSWGHRGGSDREGVPLPPQQPSLLGLGSLQGSLGSPWLACALSPPGHGPPAKGRSATIPTTPECSRGSQSSAKDSQMESEK